LQLKIQNSRTWVEINPTALYHNIDQIKALLGATELGIVVKANAYGHGMELVASLLDTHPQVHWLFTAGIQEALELRAHCITKPILVLSYYDASLEEAVKNNIDIAIYDYLTADALHNAAQKIGKRARVHIKIDTGMHRLGVPPQDILAFATHIKKLSMLDLYGIFSHFSDLNSPDLSHSYKQLATFDATLEMLKQHGITFLCTHMISSGALVLPTKHQYTLARVGTTLYGFWKSPLQQQRFLEKKPDFSLQHVLTWKTRIIQIKQVPAHSYVGYNRAFYTDKPVIIACLPIGYYDGYPRALSHKSFVLINGKKAPLVGVVSMNIITIDITNITARVDDEVILCGDYDGLRATDLGLTLDTINNEFASRINPAIPRVLVKNNLKERSI